MSGSPITVPRCPFCNTLYQATLDKDQGVRVQCPRCWEPFVLSAPVKVEGKKVEGNSVSQNTGIAQPRSVAKKNWVTMLVLVGLMLTLSVVTVIFVNQTQAFRRKRDLPPEVDRGELVALVSEGADCLIHLDGTWLAQNRLESLTSGTPLSFFAESIAQTPQKLGFSSVKELVLGLPAGAPFSTRFAVETTQTWNPANIPSSLQPEALSQGEIKRVKIPGWPLGLDVKAINGQQVVGMLAKGSGESALSKATFSRSGLATELKEMLSARVPVESPFWLVAKKGSYGGGQLELPQGEKKDKKGKSDLPPKNALIQLMEAQWAVLGAWIQPLSEEDKLLQGAALRTALTLRLEIAFEEEAQAQAWEKSREAEKLTGWKSVREKKTVSVQWKGFLETAWK